MCFRCGEERYTLVGQVGLMNELGAINKGLLDAGMVLRLGAIDATILSPQTMSR